MNGKAPCQKYGPSTVKSVAHEDEGGDAPHHLGEVGQFCLGVKFPLDDRIVAIRQPFPDDAMTPDSKLGNGFWNAFPHGRFILVE